MPTTDEALNAKRGEVEELRKQIQEADDEIAQISRENANDHLAAGLDSEANELRVTLADKKTAIRLMREAQARGGATVEAAPEIAPVQVETAPAIVAAKTSVASATKTDTNGKV